MEENVRKELDTVKDMVVRWKNSYLQWATPDGDNEFLIEEHSDEISRHVSPLVRRLYENNYLTQSEAREFLECCYSQVNELRDLIKMKEAETNQPPIGTQA
jgi:hypothetical protein